MAVTISTSAKPAPLVMTNWACHVVTSSNLFYYSLTFFTFLNVWCILPIFNLFFKSLVTTLRMRFTVTFIAYLCFTFWACCSIRFDISTDNNWTFRVRTPFQVRILLDFYISQEDFILIECLLISKFLHHSRWKR